MIGHRRRTTLCALLLITAGAARVEGHTFTITEVLAVFTADGTYQIDVTIDVDALALGVPPTEDSASVAARLRALPPEAFDAAVEQAKRTIGRWVRIRFDGEKQRPVVSFPHQLTSTPNPIAEPTVLGVTARLTGRIPDGAKAFTFGASRTLDAVHLTIVDEATQSGTKQSGTKQILGVSERSTPYLLGQAAVPMTSSGVATQYLRLGFQHILPKGLDHILFVLALFLLTTRVKPLLWQITAFTVAHSVTLALSMYGVVSLPMRLVESLIALSIAYVAIENMLTSELRPWRTAAVFTFGLLHGMGFAEALRSVGLPRGEFVTALVTFNVGVELGQVTVVLAALAAFGWCRNRTWYRRTVAIPLSAVVAVVGLYWVVQRSMG